VANINDFPYAFIRLEAVGWIQNMGTAGDVTIVMEGIKTSLSNTLRVPGLGNVMELQFNITFVRGFYDWKMAGMPEDAIGFLGHNEPDEQRDASISGGLWLPDDVFDDLWLRIRAGADFDTSLSLKAAPIDSADDLGVLFWDRADSKFLFVAGADFSFMWKRRETSRLTARQSTV